MFESAIGACWSWRIAGLLAAPLFSGETAAAAEARRRLLASGPAADGKKRLRSPI